MNKKKLFKIIFPLIFVLSVSLHSETVEMNGWELDTGKLPAIARFKIIQLLRNLDNIINVYTGETTKHHSINKCQILLIKPEEARAPIEVITLKNQNIMVYLSSDSQVWKNDYAVLRQLVELNLMNKYGISGEAQRKKFPYWISTALARKFIRKNDMISIPGLNTYPWMRLLAIKNGLNSNSFWSIFNAPLYQEDGCIFTAYAEACEILLDACYSISNADENLLTQTILLSLKRNSSPEEAFRMNVGTVILSRKIFDFIKTEGLPEKTVLGLWYNNQAETDSMRILIPANDAYSEKLFKQALTVSYHLKDGENSRIKQASIYEIEKDFKKIEDKNLLVSDIIKDLTAVKNKIPFAFHASISKIIEAVSLLQTKETTGFADKIKESEQEFATVLKSRKTLNQYMADMEKKYVVPVQKYNNQLLIIEEEQDRRRLASPLLEIYLDKLEK